MTGQKYVIPMFGGLGNQLFGYAYARYLSLEMENEVVLWRMPQGLGNENHSQNAATAFLHDRELPLLKLTSTLGLRALFSRLVTPLLGTDKSVMGVRYAVLDTEGLSRPTPGNPSEVTILSSYFRTLKFLRALQRRGQMRELRPREISSNLERLEHLARQPRTFLLHLRRGDYLRPSIQAALPSGYYLYALEALGARPTDTLILLSDSPEIVAQEFSGSGYQNILTVGLEVDPLTAAESLWVASCASNLVMSNSTFSWWAATTGNSGKNVVFPGGWNDHIMDKGWTRIAVGLS